MQKNDIHTIKILFTVFVVLFSILVGTLALLFSKGVFKANTKTAEKRVETKLQKPASKTIITTKKSKEDVKPQIKTVVKELESIQTPKSENTDVVNKVEDITIAPIVTNNDKLKNKEDSKTSNKKQKQLIKSKEQEDKKLPEDLKLNDKLQIRQNRNSFTKPKLAIIIDDVSFSSQTKGIKKIPYKVTPSFLPRSKIHPHTPKLASSFSVYMVHLPLEAINHPSQESEAFKVGFSYKKIQNEVKKIKADFPRARFYNNHMGSKFTADETSMDRLLRVFKEQNLRFMDSKTIATSKGEKMAKKYGVRFLKRDVFLDNSKKPNDIKRQLKVAIRIAKKYGFAIAICHPYKSTLKVLQNAKPMFNEVELVRVNEL